jgi:hypothetical protein|nr:MAG TPA: hypothetical protein [Caudoviricetes sp.]
MAKTTINRHSFTRKMSKEAKNLYQTLLNANEDVIMRESNPKVSWEVDNTGTVLNYLAITGDKNDVRAGEKEFNFLGQKVRIPVVEVDYTIVGQKVDGNGQPRGTAEKARVSYINMLDTQKIAELYEEAYSLLIFLAEQEVALKGILPDLVDKGYIFSDDKTKLPYVGKYYLDVYLGHNKFPAGSPEKVYYDSASDVYRFQAGSFVHQLKSNKGVWSAILQNYRDGVMDRLKTAVKPGILGTTDFVVNDNNGPQSFVTGITLPETPLHFNAIQRRDMSNTIMSYAPIPPKAPQVMNPTGTIQPSQVGANVAPAGPIEVSK